MITTYSKFYFNYEVENGNQYLDFSEGAGPELTAVIPIGSYTLTTIAAAVSAAINDAGGQLYTVSVNRATRVITISAPGVFSLKITSGSHAGSSIYSTIGFTGADLTGAITYSGNAAAGSSYSPQMKLQNFVSSEDQRGVSDAVINKAASGRIEVVSFGAEHFVEFNIKYATNQSLPTGHIIRNDSTAVEKLRTFMRFITTKAPVEFIPDEDVPNTFETLILESTTDDSKGVKYKLKELYERGMVGWFETGVLKWRVDLS